MITSLRPGLRTGRFLAAGLTSLTLAGCGEEAALSVGEVSFTETDLLGLSDTQTELLATIAAVGLATARGETVDLGGVVIEEGRRDLLIDRLRQELTLEREGITEAVLEAHYEQSPEFELTVRHLVILSERWRPSPQRDEARARAEAALARARDGEPFPELAGEVSEEPGAQARGGLLEPGREGSWVDEFWQAARRLDVGGISEVVESEYGFHVLRLDAREPIPFMEARPRVVAQVAAELDAPEAWRLEAAELTGGLSSESSAETRAREVLLAHATERGLEITPTESGQLVRAWESQIAGWAGALGFEVDMSPDDIGERALLALGRTDQNARIARDEILGHREAILAVYPMILADP